MIFPQEFKLSEKVGGGYTDYWRAKERYTVCKGGRASKKSVTTALWLIHNIMKYEGANALVVRRYSYTHRDSTFAQLKWAIHHLGVDEYWEATVSPMQLRYKPTGQKILFRGFDDAHKITSITVETGYMCWCWVEEAYEITNEEDFNKLDLSFRGELPEHLFYRFLITFNPWTEKCWLKRRFFDEPNPNVFTKTTTYMQNEFLSQMDKDIFAEMKEKFPLRYRVEGLGDWGISRGLVYENWRELEFDVEELFQDPNEIPIFGLDFGYVNSKTAFVAASINLKAKTIHIFDEYYRTGMMNDAIAQMIKDKGYAKELIIADCAEPKSIDEIKRLGVYGLRKSQKGKDSVMNGIAFIQQFQIYVHPTCSNTIIELSNYRWEEKDGMLINQPVKDFDHILDALRYATQTVKRAKQAPSNLKLVLGI